MTKLVPHSGDFGMSAWVDCADCQRDRGIPGWFAIRCHESHWIDPVTHRHYHTECGLALLAREQRDQAEAVAS